MLMVVRLTWVAWVIKPTGKTEPGFGPGPLKNSPVPLCGAGFFVNGVFTIATAGTVTYISV
jgi:hypothetical protein